LKGEKGSFGWVDLVNTQGKKKNSSNFSLDGSTWRYERGKRRGVREEKKALTLTRNRVNEKRRAKKQTINTCVPFGCTFALPSLHYHSHPDREREKEALNHK
jgi:hypothetical protein